MDSLRVESVKLLKGCLEDLAAKLLEESVFEVCQRDPLLYKMKVKQMIHHCRSSPDLVERYPPNILVLMSDRVLRGDSQEPQVEDVEDVQDEEHVEGLDKCRKCGSRDIVYKQLQLRSADEGMTLISRCRQCGNTWRD